MPMRPALPGPPEAGPSAGRASGRSLVTVLATALLLVALVPFLPLALLAWWGYEEEAKRIEQEISVSNRHIARLAGHYLEILMRQVREEIDFFAGAGSPVLPPPRAAVGWERVAGDGTVLETQLSENRVGRACGYEEQLRRAAVEPVLSPVDHWVEGRPPTVLLVGPAASGSHLVAVLDPGALHEELQGWTPEGGDRHLYVVEATGELLFYSDLELSTQGADLSDNPPIRFFVNGGDGDLRYTSVISGKQRLGTVHQLRGAPWGVVVSADVGTGLIGLRTRTLWLGLSIAFAVAAATAILAVTTRRLVYPLLDVVRALRDPGRDPKAPLSVAATTRRVREYHELVSAFDELGAEVAAVERELVQAEKTSLLGQLASGLAHEMGTPLNVITGNAEYLLRKAETDDPARPSLELIVRQAQRIAAMIRRLLDVSRPAEARLVSVDLAPLVQQCLEIVPGLNRRVEVAVDLEASAPRVLADPKLLEHALMNLIHNACQAMPDGGRLALVTGEAASAGTAASVALTVVDTGCGIAAADLPRIFEPFFSTKAQGEGTGLGLPIVDRILRQHGGRIEVTSEPGRGTVVVLWLQRAREDLEPRRRGDR